MTEGWIKLYRKFEKWEWYDDPYTKAVFLHFLIMAAHKKNNWRGISIDRGQLIIGRNKLAKTLGMTEQRIRTAIKRLRSTNELTIKSTKQFTMITICNYDEYQDYKNEVNQQLTNDLTNNQPTTNQQLTTNKNVKNVKNVKNKTKTAPVRARSFLTRNSITWIDPEIWDEWISHKVKIKASLTDRALLANIKTLESDMGNANQTISRSLDAGWKGLFPTTGDNSPNRIQPTGYNETREEGARRRNAELIRRRLENIAERENDGNTNNS